MIWFLVLLTFLILNTFVMSFIPLTSRLRVSKGRNILTYKENDENDEFEDEFENRVQKKLNERFQKETEDKPIRRVPSN